MKKALLLSFAVFGFAAAPTQAGVRFSIDLGHHHEHYTPPVVHHAPVVVAPPRVVYVAPPQVVHQQPEIVYHQPTAVYHAPVVHHSSSIAVGSRHHRSVTPGHGGGHRGGTHSSVSRGHGDRQSSH